MIKQALLAFAALILCFTSRGEDIIRPSIIGGNDTSEGAYPWMVALLRIDDQKTAAERQFCGGVLIAPNWILTAAHCVNSFQVTEFEIMVGNSDLDADYVPVFPRSIHIHPFSHSRRTSRGYDLALINIEDAFENITPIPLNRALEILQPNRSVTAIGWGLTSLTTPTRPSKLQEVQLSIGDIGKYYPSDHPANQYFIPTEASGSKKGTYAGDSGGPLVMKNEDSDEWRLVGLTSFGNASSDSPTNISFFTNVAIAYDWIQSVITLPTPPKIPVHQRILPNIKRDNETNIGYRIWPFASTRTEKLSFRYLDHLGISPVNFSLTSTGNYLPVGDGSFYVFDPINSNPGFPRVRGQTSLADIEIAPVANREYPLYRAVPFQIITFRKVPQQNSYYDAYRAAIALDNLLPNTNYQIVNNGYLDAEIIEIDPIGQQARHLGNLNFLTVAGRSYILNIRNTYASSTLSVTPIPVATVTQDTPYHHQLNENSLVFRNAESRIELAKFGYVANSKKTVISVLPEFDAELFYYNGSGVQVGYADQGAENEVDELIVGNNNFSDSQIGVTNFDANATGSFTITVKPYVDKPLRWGEKQKRGITTADESWTASNGNLYQYERLSITNTNNYSYMTVKLRGLFFEPGLVIYNSSYEDLEFQSGSGSYQTTVAVNPGAKYYIDIINYSGTWAENYEITIEGSNTDPR